MLDIAPLPRHLVDIECCLTEENENTGESFLVNWPDVIRPDLEGGRGAVRLEAGRPVAFAV